MPIRVARFEHQTQLRWGVVLDEGVIPISGDFPTTQSFIMANPVSALANHRGEPVPLQEVNILSPITRNQQFVCQGANYRQHMVESGIDPDAKHFNMIFTKAQSCIVAADSPVVIPSGIRFLDYEIELGLVLRQPISGRVNIDSDRLPDYIAGLVIVNDYSARDVQIPQMQFYKGKSFRTFGPIGPWLCLLEPEDFSQLACLQLTLRVDDEIRQSDSTANLVYGPAETLNELSGIQDFSAGDLIATGTPAGCALSIPKPGIQKIAGLLPEAKRWEMFFKAQEARSHYLRPGQTVTSHIRSVDGTIDLGIQRNVVVREGEESRCD